MERTETVDLLKEIYQNASTAVDAMQILSARSSNLRFADSLTSQAANYRRIADAASAALSGCQTFLPPATGWARLNLWADMQFRTVLDKTPAHIAQILITGSTSGMISVTHCLHADPDASPAARSLAQELLDTELACIAFLQDFL